MQITQVTKSVMKPSVSLVVAAMLLTAVIAVSAAAQKQVPFKGSLQGHETGTPEGGPPPTTVIWQIKPTPIQSSSPACYQRASD